MHLKKKLITWLLFLFFYGLSALGQEQVTFPILHKENIYTANTVNFFIQINTDNQIKQIADKDQVIQLEQSSSKYQISVYINNLQLDPGLNQQKFCLQTNVKLYQLNKETESVIFEDSSESPFACQFIEQSSSNSVSITQPGWKRLDIFFTTRAADNTDEKGLKSSPYSSTFKVTINEKQLNFNQEIEAVASLKKEFSLPLLNNYLKKYPTGKYKKQVDQLTWEALDTSVVAAHQYLYFFPNGQYIKNAQKILTQQPKFSMALAWDSVQVYGYPVTTFLDNFPKSPYNFIAYDYLIQSGTSPISYKSHTILDTVFIQLFHTMQPTVFNINENTINLLDTSILATQHSFKVQMQEPKQQNIQIQDILGQSLTIPIGTPLSVQFNKSSLKNDTLFSFHFHNGFPPYTLHFSNLDNAAQSFFHKGIQDSIFSITKQQMMEKYPKGQYTIAASDFFKETYILLPGAIQIKKPEKYTPLLLGGLGVLGLITFLFINAKNKAKKKPSQSIKINDRNIPPINTTKSKQQHIKTNAIPTQRKIKIKRKVGATSQSAGYCDPQAFKEKLQMAAYQTIDLNNFWHNSSVKHIFFYRQCIYQIDRFLKAENIEKYREDTGETPEIGGFLLGSYSFDEKQHSYEVTFEEFVSIASKKESRYELEFSTTSIVENLGQAQVAFPNLSLIGWFHTHPGHGLFLSLPDLAIQRGFFREPFQIAMEIDSLSPMLDTGFFSWKIEGAMNNTSNSKKPLKWMSWTALEKSIAQL